MPSSKDIISEEGEWFDLQPHGQDAANLQAYLYKSQDGGLRLSVVSSEFRDYNLHKLTEKNSTINGYLDFQTPASLINPYLLSFSPGKIGRDAKFLRTKFTLGIHAIATNIHLTSADEPCFSGFSLHSPALHVYLKPQLISRDFESKAGHLIPIIDFSEPKSLEFSLPTGEKVKIHSSATMSLKLHETEIRESTWLRVQFDEPSSFQRCQETISRIHFFFCFLTGVRLSVSEQRLHTTKKYENEDEYISCDVLYKSGLRNYPSVFPNNLPALTNDNSNVPLEELFAAILKDQNRNLTYFMDMILCAENHEGEIDDRFIELIGLLEEFHICEFDQGRRTLLERLTELKSDWTQDGFRGNPDLEKFKRLRNVKSHGRGHEYSIDDIQYIAHVTPFLLGLSRYHILKKLGFDRNAIGRSFRVVRLGLGAFVPEDLLR